MTAGPRGDGAPGLARLGALAAPGVREALAYARAAGGPITVDDAADALGCHRTVARRRLDRLEAAGLLAADFRRPAGRSGPGAGRPAKVFRVPPDVEVLEFPSHRYAELVGLLLDEPPGPGTAERERLARVGRRFAGVLAGDAAACAPAAASPEASLDAVCALLGRLGYQASVLEATAEGGRLLVPTCPLRPVVVAGPAAAEIDRGMWQGLLGLVSGRDQAACCSVEGCLDPSGECTVELRLAAGSPEAQSDGGGPTTSAP
jgi:predicted ArsR family transcriptional regulator